MIIEKGLPVPPKRTKYPFGEMGVGDSVFFQIDFFDGMSKQQLAAHQYGRKHGMKFRSQKVRYTDTQPAGVRIWRVE